MKRSAVEPLESVAAQILSANKFDSFPPSSSTTTASPCSSVDASVASGSPASISDASGSPSSNSVARRARCPICGGPAFNKHFGSMSCNACAAFFRRTVAFQQRYVCAHDQTCKILTGEGRGFCKYCRFQRCLRSGMVVTAVCSTRKHVAELPNLETGTLLWKVVTSQRATFVNRFKSIIKMCGDQKTVRIGGENPDFKYTVTTMISEMPVLVDYLESTGFPAFGITRLAFSQLVARLFYPWIGYTCMMNTLRNGGHKTGIAYGVDESHMRVDDGIIRGYVETCPGLLDYETVAKYTKQTFTESINTVECLHAARMVDVEHCAMFHIFALKTAVRLFPDNREIQAELSQFFGLLKQHFDRNYENPALRIGNVVLMLGELERITTFFEEYIAFLNVNGYNSILSRFRATAMA